MPAPELILIKHSLPEIDPGLPAAEWHLSAEGRRRCQALAEKLASHSPQVLFSSREPKAEETARLVAQRLGLATQSVDGLHEHRRTREAFTTADAFTANMQHFFDHPNELVFGEESAAQAQQRFSVALAGLCAQHPGQTLAVVAHGTVITLFALENTASPDLHAFEFWQRLGLPSMVVFERPELRLRHVVEEIV